MKILFLSTWFPYPPNNGSKLRVYNLLKALARHHEVTLISFLDQPELDSNPEELRQICRDIRTTPLKPFRPRSLKARLGFFRLVPRSVLDTFSPELAGLITQALAETKFDVVIASQINMAGYGRYFAPTPALFEEVEVGVLYEQFAQAQSFSSRLRFTLTWFKHRYYLAKVLSYFQASTVVSEPERMLLQKKVLKRSHHRVEVLPNCMDVPEYAAIKAQPQPNSLIFTGSFTFSPNYEAMRWFTNEVLPLLQREIPDVHLTITGNRAGLPLPDSVCIEHVGFVDDVRPLIASSWASLAPIWTGGGTRLKILEAMALRTPVIATTKGAEGLDVQSGVHLLLADTPQEFAEATIRLLQEPNLRQQLADKAYELVCEKYDWTAVAPRLLHLLKEITHD